MMRIFPPQSGHGSRIVRGHTGDFDERPVLVEAVVEMALSEGLFLLTRTAKLAFDHHCFRWNFSDVSERFHPGSSIQTIPLTVPRLKSDIREHTETGSNLYDSA